MSKMMMNPADVKVIAEIIEEHDITGNFDLVYHDTSGIGYCIYLLGQLLKRQLFLLLKLL